MTYYLEPCPFCGGKPKRKLSKVSYCQLHGEPSQEDIIYCNNHLCPVKPVLSHGLSSNKENWEETVRLWNTRAQPKMERVDLDGMKEPDVGFGDCGDSTREECDARVCGYNRAIDDIKAKYGDLYVEVK